MPISRVYLRAIARKHATRGALRAAMMSVGLVVAGVIAGLGAPTAFAWKVPQVAALCATDAPSAALLVSMSGLTAFLVGFGVFVLSLNRQDRGEHIRIRVKEDERE